METNEKEIHILLVEDNEGDIVLAKEALSEARIKSRISVMMDGEEALAYLFNKDNLRHDRLPDLILLDINLPKVDGLEVLAKIKAHDELKAIPVVMLTTSTSERDVLFAYRNYANSYINKPIDPEKILAVIKNIESFWLNIVKFPVN
jgi:chemotaxis family two-component system response regulator Rcp1